MRQDVLSWIGRIYDCAADPDLWPSLLTGLRDELNAAYVMVSLADYSEIHSRGYVFANRRTSPWDQTWLDRLEPYLRQIPGTAMLYTGNLDTAWREFEQMEEALQLQTPFYQEWALPQGLRDCINLKCFDRPGKMMGVVSAPSYATRADYTPAESHLIEALSPHVRRALAINDIIDKGKLAQALYRSILDKLATAVIVTGAGGRILFANAAGDALLSDGTLVASRGGTLAQPAHQPGTGLEEALARAAASDDALGIHGIGVPLRSVGGQRAAAYVLPISGKGARRELGQGHAVTFIATRAEQQPVTVEILRTVHNLTPAQAKAAALVAEGKGPAEISMALGVSVATVRSHLAQAFAKTGCADQTSLAAAVHALMPPVS